MARHSLTVSRPVFCLTLLVALIAMSQILVFAQSASLATLPRKNPQPVKVENSSADTAAKLVAEGMRIEEPASADSRRKAIEKYLEAIPLWQAANDTAAEARTLALIASAYIGLGEKQNAFDFVNRALPLSEKAVKDCSEQEKPAAVGVKAYVLDTLGRANQDFGDRKKARELYSNALSLSQSVGDRLGELNSLINLGKASILLSDYQKALELSERALQMINELGERRKQTIVLNNMCLIYQSTSAFEKAFEVCKQAISTARDTNSRSNEANAIQNLGSTYYRTGDYQKAIDLYVESKEIFKEMGNRRGEAAALTNIGRLYMILGDLEKPIDPWNQALVLWRAIGDLNREVIVLNNLAANYHQRSDYRKALEMHLQILPLRERLNEDEGKGITLENMAQCYDHLGEKQKALDYHEQAITLLRQAEPGLLAGALKSTGKTYRDLGNHQKGLELLNEALKIFRQVGDRYNEGVTLAETAYLERARGNLFEAKKLIGQGLAVLESVRSSVKSEQMRASFLATAKNYYEFETDLLMRLHQQRPADGFDTAAFASSEKGRARSLLEMLTESRTEIREGVDSSLLAREQALRDSIAEKAERQVRLLSGQHTNEEAEKVSKEIDALTTEYEQVQARIRETSPRYAALTQPLPLSLKDIQTKVLDSETLLLEYALGEERSFLWAITKDSITTFELPKRQDVEAAARKVYELVTERNRVVKDETLAQRRLRVARSDDEYQRAAVVLSNMLLQPAATQLKGKRLLFVSDGVLQYVPFASLPVPTAGPPSSYRPLILDHEIINLPSASVMAALREETAGRKRAPKALAVLADPVFQSDDPRIGQAGSEKASSADASTEAYRSAKESGLDSFVRLRFTREEANEITRLVSSDKRLEALDFAASRANATSAALDQYQIVHFATHGLINNRHPELSGIVLSLVDEKGQAQNGFLRLYEIYNLKLGADLVVLSACQTAVGQEIRGEGLLGLTRGFMYAGAPRVVATLWQVDDRATSELMKRFYQKMLGEGLRPAAALKAAQVSMQTDKRWASPHYWAAFTLHGEWK
ncbi:MAG TPA: CHAT domain-containing protein [Pyrinomonadaceae bacterium]|nr:CHAT domain-containing protein [Pyrinomonadaceae bacterium]